MKIFVLHLLIFLGVTHEAFASTSPNLIRCAMVNIGGVAQCEVVKLEVLARQQYEVVATFEGNFRCGPGEPSALQIGVGAELNKIPFELGKVTEIKVTGHGPFTVFDDQPAETFENIFAPGCSLVVSLKKVEPSGTTKRNWVIQQAQLEGQIEKMTKARMAFEALAVYKEAFFFLGELHSAITRDLATHIELRNQLAKGTSLRVMLEDFTLNTVHIIDPSTSNIIHTVTRNEKLLLLNLLNEMDQLPPISECIDPSDRSKCTEFTLDSYLSNEQKKTLEALANFGNVADSAAQNAAEFAKFILALEQEKIELCKTSIQWIEWKAIPVGCF